MRITRVYTRTGDQGKTRLVGGQQVKKDAPRIEAYGTVDELNAALGLARTFVSRSEADDSKKEHIEQMLNTAEYITRLYVTSFRESARLLAALHEEVPEGNWLAFLDSGALPFNRRTAQDLCSAWSWLKDCDLTDQQLAKAFRSKRALAKVAIAEDDVRQAIEARVLAGEQITAEARAACSQPFRTPLPLPTNRTPHWKHRRCSFVRPTFWEAPPFRSQ